MSTMRDLHIKKLGLQAKELKIKALKATGLRKEILLTQSKLSSLRQKEMIERRKSPSV